MKSIKRLVYISITLILLLISYFIYDGYTFHKATISEKPIEQVIESIKNKESYTAKEDIPDIYFKALVAVEDRRFYQHKGFDAIGTTRALVNDIKSKKLLEGGSTITQQLAKNMYYPLDQSLRRKIAEVFTAYSIEEKYSKEDILELYVNCVYYGSGYYSIFDASMGYFNKKPSQLTDFEATLLVGIPNAPSVYSLDVNPQLALQRQKQVINAMVDCEYMTEEEAQIIVQEQEKFMGYIKTNDIFRSFFYC